MKADLLFTANYSVTISLIGLVIYAVAGLVERRLRKSGNKHPVLWGALTFFVGCFLTMFAVITIILMNIKFNR